MTFNIAQFSKDSKDSNSSLVKEYELNETRRPSLEDITAARADTWTVIMLTAGITGPALIMVWQYLPISFTTIIMVTVMIVATVGLIRYERIATMMNTSDGRVNWEHLKHESTSKGKAEIQFVRDYQNAIMDHVNGEYKRVVTEEGQEVYDVIRSEIVSPQQLKTIAQAVLTHGKFNQDVVCKSASLDTKRYGDFINEMMKQRLLTMRGKDMQQGVKLSERGYKLFRQLAPTPLLTTAATKSAENQTT